MFTYICRMCGKEFNSSEDMVVDNCSFCGSLVTLPCVSDEKQLADFLTAQKLRVDGKFDQAEAEFDKILKQLPDNAEAHFGKFISRYGLEYHEEWGGSRQAVCHNQIAGDVFADEDYQASIRSAKREAKEIYETVAYQISTQQTKTDTESVPKETFDVMIIDREKDENNNTTVDDRLARSLYDFLLNKGYEVFYPTETLKGKNEEEKENCIDAAISSAKVLAVVSTKGANAACDEVRFYWKKFLNHIAGQNNPDEYTLIPCYDIMDPIDLPEDFSGFQAVNLSGGGETEFLSIVTSFVLPKNAPVPVASASTNPETDGSSEDNSADETEEEEEFEYGNPEDFARDPSLMADFNSDEDAEVTYVKACELQTSAKTDEALRDAASLFKSITGYKDSAKRANDCMTKANESYNELLYQEAMKNYKRAAHSADYTRTKLMFETISGYKDADSKARECEILAKRLGKEEKQKYGGTIGGALMIDNAVNETLSVSGASESDNSALPEQKKMRIILLAVIIVIVLIIVIFLLQPVWAPLLLQG